ncbi:MAG: hypothetical protein AAGF78_07325 [Pseudomonadota bacterium]
MRPFFTVAALSTLPLAVSAQPAPPAWAELIALDSVLTWAVQTGITAARSQADVVYEHLDVAGGGQIITLSGLVIYPILDTDEDCEIVVDRLTLTSSAWGELNDLSVRIDTIGTAFDVGCLPPEARQGLAVLGQDRLTLDHAVLSMAYHVPSAGADLRFTATSAENVEIAITATADYLAFEDAGSEPLPVIFLEDATVSLTNLGLWEKLSPLVPPEMLDPAVLGPLITQQVLNLLQDGGSVVVPTATEQAFVASLGEAASAFVADPRRLVLEMRPDGPTYMDFYAYEDDGLRPLIEDTRPLMRTSPSSEALQIEPAILRAALAGDAPRDEMLRVGRALLTGDGAPKNPARALEILGPMAETLDGTTLAALSQAAPDPLDAYGLALRAAAAGGTGTDAALAEAEDALGLEDILATQTAVSPAVAGPSGNETALRSAALTYLTGTDGTLRNYTAAALYASLAAAGGDAAAGAILDELDARFGHDPAWRAASAEIAQQATDIWASDSFHSE